MNNINQNKLWAKVADLYHDGRTIAEICKLTGIRSSATIYNIITQLGIKGEKGKYPQSFSLVLKLPIELREWCEAQADLSAEFAKFVYSQIESKKLEKHVVDSLNSKVELPFNETERTPEEVPSAKMLLEKRVVESLNSKVELPFNETERAPEEIPSAKMLVVFTTKRGETVFITSVESYIDENIVKSVLVEFCKQKYRDIKEADEVWVYYEGQSLWMWKIKRLHHGQIEGLL